MKKNILFISYMYLDSHLCKISRLSILEELSNLDNKCYLHAAATSNKSIIDTKNIGLSYVLLPGIQILNFLTYQIKSFFLIPRIIFNKKIDVIICDINSTPSIFLLLVLKKLKILNINFILDFRSNILHHRKNALQNFLKKYYLIFWLHFSKIFYNGFTFITTGVKKILEKNYRISFGKHIFWSSAVPSYFLKPALIKESPDFIIFHHGHLERGRGIMRLIKAIPYIKDTNNKIVLKIAGNGTLSKEIKQLSFQKKYKLKFLGQIDHKNIIDFIDSAKLCVIPFDNSVGNATSSPLKLMEYIARDKSIIATKLENFVNDFSDYSKLYYMDNNNPESIAKSIDSYILNYNNLTPISNEGHNIIKRKFTWEIQAKKINNFLENI